MGMGLMAKAYKSNKGKMWTGTAGEKMMGASMAAGVKKRK